jgi:hypothetical protein
MSAKNHSLKEQLHGALQMLEPLRSERDKLQTQVSEMMKFLEDYGLTWVGCQGG